MLSKASLVSIVIPCFNAEPWIEEAITSCLEQTYRPIEIIVVDDGSTDNSREILESLRTRYPAIIRTHYQQKQGAPAARNKGMRLAEGGFVLFFDADDYLQAEALEDLIDALDSSVDGVYGNAAYVGPNREFIRIRDQSSASADPIVRIMRVAPRTGTLLLRLSAARRSSWNESLPCAQEFAYFVDLAMLGCRFTHIPTTVVYKREHLTRTRITVRAKNELSLTLASLYSNFDARLMQMGQSTDERREVIHVSLVSRSLVLWKQGYKPQAREFFAQASKKTVLRSRYLKRPSWTMLACLTGLKLTTAAQRTRDRLLLVLHRLLTLVLNASREHHREEQVDSQLTLRQE